MTFLLPKCSSAIWGLPITLGGCNFGEIVFYDRRINPENCSLLAFSKVSFEHKQLSLSYRAPCIYAALYALSSTRCALHARLDALRLMRCAHALCPKRCALYAALCTLRSIRCAQRAALYALHSTCCTLRAVPYPLCHPATPYALCPYAMPTT